MTLPETDYCETLDDLYVLFEYFVQFESLEFQNTLATIISFNKEKNHMQYIHVIPS